MPRRTDDNADNNDARHADEPMSRTADDDDNDNDDNEYDESDDDSRTVAAVTWDERLAGTFLAGWPSLAVSLTMLVVAWAIQQHQQQHVAVSSLSSSFTLSTTVTTSQQQQQQRNKAVSVTSSGRQGIWRDDDDDGDEAPIPAYVAQYSTYASLGAKPESIGPPHIYDIIYADHDDSTTRTAAADSISTRLLLNATHLDAYRNDGVICFRGLLSDDLLAQLDVETAALLAERAAAAAPAAVNQKKQQPTQFHTVEHSAMFRNIIIDHNKTNNLDGHDDAAASKNRTITAATTTRDFPALLQAALFSNISRVAAELLGLATTTSTSMRPECNDVAESLPQQPPQQQTLRVIRDIFLAKDNEEYTCGWHVDDLGFWPATPGSPEGINAWVALDDMELVDETGGFALAVQSHVALWRMAAYYWGGAPLVDFPDPHGYADAADLFRRRTGSGTCHLATAAPHLHRRLEETARVYPVRRGDVIFHTRWMFHRTVPVARQSVTKTNHDRVMRRYSIRYGPGETTIIPPGYGTELSTLWDPSNGGLSATAIAQRDGPWYPQAWPHLSQDPDDLSTLTRDLVALVRDKMPIAVERRKARVREMRPFLRQLAVQQQQQEHHER